jgi:hypothetical protein
MQQAALRVLSVIKTNCRSKLHVGVRHAATVINENFAILLTVNAANPQGINPL